MKRRRILFRADGNQHIGLGHIIRSLALADMLKDVFDCQFITRRPISSIKNKILKICSKIIELPDGPVHDECPFLLQQIIQDQDMLVLDGYEFNTEYQEQIQDHVYKLICIDDVPIYRFLADVVINHAPGLDPGSYVIADQTKLLLGTKYALLRRPFLEIAGQPRKISQLRNAFICFGGADSLGISIRLATAISKDPEIEQVHLVLGAATSFGASTAAQTSKVIVYRDLDAETMCQLMQECDMAIAPASTICYELAAVKMPLICGYYVDNQKNIYQGFLKSGAIIGVGDFKTLSNSKIMKVISKLRTNHNFESYMSVQAELFDARIKARLLETFMRLC